MEENPRISYTCKVIFEYIFQIPYKIHVPHLSPIETDIFTLNYTPLSIDNSLQIPQSGLLSEKNIQVKRIEEASQWIHAANIAEKNNSPTTKIISYDIFSIIFFLTSNYEKYAIFDLDKYGRYEETQYPSFSSGIRQKALVHQYCDDLLAMFPQGLQVDIIKKRQFDYELTWDIDHPWKYLHKGRLRFYLGFLRDIWKRNGGNLMERIQILFSGKKDPNDTYQIIKAISPPSKTTFFFLIGTDTVHDSLFGTENAHFQSLIQSIYKEGYSIGIHPSFSTYLDASKIENETKALSEIIKAPIFASRQHFLRYRFPDTFRHLLAAGIKKDYSLCLVNDIGFPCGMATPFPWYDLENEEITDLMIYPAMVMDRSLESYIKGTKEEKMEKFRSILTQVKHFGGKFIFILHNDSLSESREWRGWSDTIKEMIGEIVGGDFDSAQCKQ